MLSGLRFFSPRLGHQLLAQHRAFARRQHVVGRTLVDQVNSVAAKLADGDVHVLLVEDDPGDVLMTQEAFELHQIANPLHVVSDGDEAIRFLRRQDPYLDVPRPSLILLDLNMPKKGGHEVLAEIKTDPSLRSIPVVVLTTSTADEDIARSYDSHTNAYVTKPVDITDFMSTVRQIDEFFVSIARRPTTPPRPGPHLP